MSEEEFHVHGPHEHEVEHRAQHGDLFAGRIVASCGGGRLLILALEVDGAPVAADALSRAIGTTALPLPD